MKMLTVLWLVLPQTQGSLILYRHFLHPTLASHEADIDDRLIVAGSAAQQLGSDMGRRGLVYLHQGILFALQKVPLPGPLILGLPLP
jgi:hypothetical protein